MHIIYTQCICRVKLINEHKQIARQDTSFHEDLMSRGEEGKGVIYMHILLWQ